MFLARFHGRIPPGRSFLKTARFHSCPALLVPKLQKFNLADIGEGITECEVISWSVKSQGTVQAFDVLCEVQSDKASVEITSPFDGVLKQILVKEGEVGKVGEPLCLIETEDGEEADCSETTLSEDQPRPALATSPPTGPAAVPLTNGASQAIPRRHHPLDPNKPAESARFSSDDALAVPSVRHFAMKNGIFDLSKLMPGSGKNGRIEKSDVEAYLAGATASTPRLPLPEPAVTSQGEDLVVELARTRYGMWKAMVKSLEIPHFGYSTTLDLTELHCAHYLPTSSQSNAPSPVSSTAILPDPPSSTPIPGSGQYTKLTYLPVLLKTLSRAMAEWPLFRSSITPQTPPSTSSPLPKPTLTIRPGADISIALSTHTGLYTPTIRNVSAHSVYSLASALKHLSHLGRQVPCGLTPTEMPKRGGTITVSNVGAIGDGDFASPVLVPGGGVAIVAIGRAKWVWDVSRNENGQGERRLKVGVSWSADHRVVEGAELAAFVETWRGWVENPQRMIADGV
ncbi:CoA-dependent acyltransferase [Thelephora ganbajun]|uniref:CoA-dependent acyltransferase n=1 Tax=Thelephora ganbajun TaxID=370292 RepID=A0ACB6Z3M3_THEGA|nr:CoA-dependent acyltransferase [Thelephora ganbajun]